MGDLLQPWHLIVLAVVAFLLFGAKRLPELGKGLGEGLKGFKEGLKGITEPSAPTTTAQNTTPPPPNSTPADQKKACKCRRPRGKPATAFEFAAAVNSSSASQKSRPGSTPGLSCFCRDGSSIRK